jgi:hypothetical protein
MTTQEKTDTEAIIQTASDYYGGWYSANPRQIDRSLHPSLVKRAIRKNQAGEDFLYNLDKGQMVEKTRQGGGTDIPAANRRFEVTILDRYEEIAAVKVVGYEYIDYLQLAKENGQWLIVNALWTDNRANQKM